MRLRNVHTAEVGGLAPGAEGDLDAENPSVAVALAAKLLVPADAPAPDAAVPAPPPAHAAPSTVIEPLVEPEPDATTEPSHHHKAAPAHPHRSTRKG